MRVCSPNSTSRRANWTLSVRRAILSAYGAACMLAAGVAAGTVEDLAAALQARGLVFDRAAAGRGALEGWLRAVDPEVQILPADGAGAMTNARPALEAAERWPENLVYLRVGQLGPGAGEEIAAHLLAAGGAEGVIFDLRGKTGTNHLAVVHVASLFHCPGEPLFCVRNGRGETVATHAALPGPPAGGPPFVVLVDGHTSGTAELLAAVLKGCPRVLILGETTRGDGRMRELFPLPDGQVAWLAVGEFDVKQSGSYRGRGVVPDLVVPPVGDATEAVAAENGGLSRGKPLSAKSREDRDLMWQVAADPGLQRATDLLLGLKALGSHAEPDRRTDRGASAESRTSGH